VNALVLLLLPVVALAAVLLGLYAGPGFEAMGEGW
jgi:hypothetical protein